MSNPGEFYSHDQREAARFLGYPDLPEVVESVAVAVDRGHHVALLAAAGSGHEILFGLAVARRCNAQSEDLQALMLTATRETAAGAARAAHALGAPSGLRALLWTGEGMTGARPEPGPPSAAGKPADAVHVLCGRPGELLAAVRAGRLRLEALRLLVLDELHAYDAAEAWPAVEAILDTVSSDTQRIACSATHDDAFESMLERKLPRARRWPPELFGPAGPEAEPPPPPGGIVWAAAEAGEEEGLDRLAGALRGELADPGDRAVVGCRDGDTAKRVGAGLAVRGLSIAADPGDPGVHVSWGDPAADAGPSARVGALFGLPPALATFTGWLEPAAQRIAVVPPAHLLQLDILARRAGWAVHPLPSPLGAEAREPIDRYRDLVLHHAAQVDAAPQLTLLAPLLERLGPVQVAAVLSELLRESGRAVELAARTATPSPPAPSAAAARPAWTRIFLNVGKKDGAGPGDIVGAITGETPAVAAQIGKIEVRPTYSLVDLDSLVAEQVVTALHGTRIKGRTVEARVNGDSRSRSRKGSDAAGRRGRDT